MSGVVVLNGGRDRGGLTEDVASEQRLEDSERVSHVNKFKGRGKQWQWPRF